VLASIAGPVIDPLLSDSDLLAFAGVANKPEKTPGVVPGVDETTEPSAQLTVDPRLPSRDPCAEAADSGSSTAIGCGLEVGGRADDCADKDSRRADST